MNLIDKEELIEQLNTLNAHNLGESRLLDKVFDIVKNLPKAYNDYEEMKFDFQMSIGGFVVYDKRWNRLMKIIKINKGFISYYVFGTHEYFVTKWEKDRFYSVKY